MTPEQLEYHYRGRLSNDCKDPDCLTQGCPEHPTHDVPDHTYEQHHCPEDHVGDGPCRCTAYQD